MREMKKATLLFIGLLVAAFVNAQSTTNISGIVNTLSTVVNSVNNGTNSANVASTAGFSIGDTVLLIQMQGATENITNSANFGDITNLNNAGKYEFNIICDIDGPGSNLIFQTTLINNYDAGGGVQVIHVPTYDNVIVNGQLTANDWDGSTGGVLVFWARGWARLLTGNCVMMDNRGFRGGDHQILFDGCGCAFGGDPTYTDYYYPYNDNRGAHKGEGIAPYTAGREGGRGKHTIGGGGGNDHNGGGGGGGNFGAGGDGGEPCATRSCFLGQYCRGMWPGRASVGMSTSYSNIENRIFLGGGGGAGDDNGGAGSGGTDGGGIVIIVADSINGNGANIFNRGTQAGTGAGDGTGGGGAGGTVLISSRAFQPTVPLQVFVNGGNGGLHSWSDDSRDYNSKGKGGGGGGGVFWYSGAAVPGNITVTNNGGNAGVEVAATSCNGHTGGATPGATGTVLTNLSIPFSSNAFGICVLPVEYAFVKAEPMGAMVRIDWQTYSESNSSHFDIERSTDGKTFEAIGRELSQGLSGTYSHVDVQPHRGMNFYRLKQVDINGSFQYSQVMAVAMEGDQVVLTKLFPNPIQQNEFLAVEVALPQDVPTRLSISDAFGKLVYQDEFTPSENLVQLEIPMQGLAGGVYFLKIASGSRSQIVRRLVVVE